MTDNNDPHGRQGAMPEPVILDRQSTLDRLQGDDEFLAALYAAFHVEIDQRMERMRDTLHAGDLASLGQQAHSLKGASSTIDALAVRQAALDLEEAAKCGSQDGARRHFQTLEGRMADLARAMGPYLPEA